MSGGFTDLVDEGARALDGQHDSMNLSAKNLAQDVSAPRRAAEGILQALVQAGFSEWIEHTDGLVDLRSGLHATAPRSPWLAPRIIRRLQTKLYLVTVTDEKVPGTHAARCRPPRSTPCTG